MNSEYLTNLFGLENKTALVTGGSRGIGEMIAGSLLDAGAQVMITSRKVEPCIEAAERLSLRGPCEGFQGDVSTPEGVIGVVDEVRARTDHLDILVNNAGATWGAPFSEHPVEGWDKVMNTNVRGTFLLTRELLPLLAEQAVRDDPARVINIGSVDGITSPMTESYGYSASKAAVHMLTRHLARHLADRNITVNAIAPGLFESKMTSFIFNDPSATAAVVDNIPMGRIGAPEDAGGTAVWLASRAGAYVTGAIIPVSGGYAIL